MPVTIVYRWKSKYGGMERAGTRRSREVEAENGWLKRLLTEAHLDNEVLKDLLSKLVRPAARGEAVSRLMERHGMSQRWACQLPGYSFRFPIHVGLSVVERMISWRRAAPRSRRHRLALSDNGYVELNGLVCI